MDKNRNILNVISMHLPVIVFLLTGFYGATLGFGGGDDASSVYGIVDVITSWHYHPSRVWGYPGYEIPAAFIVKYFGLYVGNLYALFWGCIYLFFSYLIIRNSKNFYLVFPALVLSPLLLIDNSILLDYTQEAGLFVMAVWLALRYESTGDSKWLYPLVPVMSWDVLTRPDYVVFVGCLFFALVSQKNQNNSSRLKIFLLFLLAGLITIGAFFLLNGGFDNFTKINYLLDSPLWRRPPRALFGIIIMLTPIGFLATVYIAWLQRKKIQKAILEVNSQNLLNRLLLFSVVFGLGRYFLQPDKLEFIFWEFTVFLFVLAFADVRKYLIMLITIPIAVSPFVTIALFDRDFSSYELKFSPSVQYGAFIQKSEKRQWSIYREKSNFDSVVIDSVLKNFPECKSVTFGYLDYSVDCLIADKWTMHQVLGLTATSGSKAINFKEVLVSDLPIDGWRGFRVSQSWESFDKTKKYFEEYKSLPLKKYEVKTAK